MHVSMTSKQAAAALAAVLIGLSVGCTVGPHYHSPAAPAVASYTPQPQPKETVSSAGPAGNIQHLNPSAEIPAQWWTMFHSPELNGMVSEALRNSPTLVQASARLKQAEEELTARTGATKYPSVSGAASVQGEQVNLSAYGIPFPNPSPFALLNGSVAVSYALDLFGANRRLIEGLRAEREYQEWQLEGARLMLAGNVVSAAIREAQLQTQIEITRKLLGVQQQELKITEQRYRAGGVSDYDVRSQRTAVAQTEAMLPPLQLEMDVVHDQLALLMGKSPANSGIVSISLASLRLPEEVPVSLPSALVSQRPDIRAAEALLHQASANVGVATANLYPQILLSGSGGGLGTNFTTGGDIWNVGASLTQPIFNGGALQAERRKARQHTAKRTAFTARLCLRPSRKSRMLSMQFSTTLRRCGRGPRLPVKLRRPMRLRRSATRLEASVTLVCSMRNASSCKRRWIRQRRQQAVIQTRRRWCRHSAADGGTRPAYPLRQPAACLRETPYVSESPCPRKRLRERRKEESSSSPGCKADPGRALQPG